MIQEPEHTLEMQVRDYELDLQGIVNNAVYFNYLEHARHQFLMEKGVDFEGLFKEGIAAMVIHADIKYKKSLVGKDEFIVETNTEKKGRFKLLFHQSIYTKKDRQLCIEAVITAASININTRKPVEMNW